MAHLHHAWNTEALGLRPIYHHKALRTEGHLFINTNLQFDVDCGSTGKKAGALRAS